MREPEFSDFPLDEYLDRIKRLRPLLQKAELDALLVTRKENVIYFTGLLNQYYWITHWDDEAQYGLLPASENEACSLLMPEGMYQSARTSWIDDLHLWSQYRPDSKRTSLAVVVSAIKDKGLAKSKIGIEIGNNDRMAMSFAFYPTFPI